MAVTGCLLMLVLTPIGIVMRGFVLQQLWSWFVVPLGVVAISLPWALGLACLAYMLTGPAHLAKQDTEVGKHEVYAAMFKYAFLVIGNPLFGLLGGWLWHSWM